MTRRTKVAGSALIGAMLGFGITTRTNGLDTTDAVAEAIGGGSGIAALFALIAALVTTNWREILSRDARPY